MKKILLGILCFMFLIGNVFAVSADSKKYKKEDYETKNFVQILESEGIEKKFKSYEETADQVTIYMFRGDGCGYCKAFLEFLNSITDEYGKYFKVVGFEVWSNEENSKLMQSVSAFLDSPAQGVPYIIIGDQVFPGYASTYDDSIKQTIMSEYEKTDRIDVMDEYNKEIDKAVKAANGNAPTIIFWNFVFIACATVIILYFNKKQNQKLLEELSSRRK